MKMDMENLKLHKLVNSIRSSHVQGLFMYMFVEKKNMNEVAWETGISRQTLSTWKRGGNVTHGNVEKVAQHYSLKTHLLYDASSLMRHLIANENDPQERARVSMLLGEYAYLTQDNPEIVES